jgi:hypothetical protein
MTATMTHARRALSILVILPFMLGIGSSAALSEENPKEVSGFGEAVATTIETTMVAGGVKAQNSFGETSLGAIGDTVGNRFSFAFGASRDAEGHVAGQLFLRDHDLGLTVSTDIAILEPHPKRGAVVGVEARGLNYIARIRGPIGSAVVNGEPRPGWEFRMWLFDGETDAVCITLNNPNGAHVYNWVGTLSSGDLKTK